MARPRKPDSDRRTARLDIRFAAGELEQLALQAERAGLPLSAYVREAALKGRVTVPARRRLDWTVLDELRRIGVNLNQAVRVANRRGFIAPELVRAATAVEAFLMREIAEDGAEGRG